MHFTFLETQLVYLYFTEQINELWPTLCLTTLSVQWICLFKGPCFLLPPLSSSVHSPDCSQNGLWNYKSYQGWSFINCLLFLSVSRINSNSAPCPTRPGLNGLLSLPSFIFPTILLATIWPHFGSLSASSSFSRHLLFSQLALFFFPFFE